MYGPVVHMPTWASNSHHGFPHARSHLSTHGSLLLHWGYPLECQHLTLMPGSTGEVRTPVTNPSPCEMEQEGCSPDFKGLGGIIHLVGSTLLLTWKTAKGELYLPVSYSATALSNIVPSRCHFLFSYVFEVLFWKTLCHLCFESTTKT